MASGWPGSPRSSRVTSAKHGRPAATDHAANTARAEGLAAVPADVAAPLIKAFRHGVILGQVKKTPGRKQAPFRQLLQCLGDRQDELLRFTTDLRIPRTSNQAERDLRPAKTQQKISGQLRSEQHPAPVRHPRLHRHRPQAQPQRPDRHPRRPRRRPLDTANPRPAITPAGTPPSLPKAINLSGRPECLRQIRAGRRRDPPPRHHLRLLG
jgi:hypothetical protein